MKNKIPKPVKLFLLKATLLFSVWKLLYLLYLLPHRTLDKPLTSVLGVSTVTALNAFDRSRPYSTGAGIHTKELPEGGTISEAGMDIFHDGNSVLFIADACNGLELMVLYAGLIICLPSSSRRKWLFITSGFLFIEVINVLRCMGLVQIYRQRPDWLNFAHHYLFSFIVYAAIFWLWYIFSRDRGVINKFHLNAQVGVQ
jgi:exosortase/archaeosortase family protein